jgi:hypothetical protein
MEVYKEFYLLGYNACSPRKIIRRVGGTCRPHFRLKLENLNPSWSSIACKMETGMFDDRIRTTNSNE